MDAAAPRHPGSAALTARAVLRVVVIVLLVLFTLYLVYLLRKPLTWIFIAGFIAIALSGPVIGTHTGPGLVGVTALPSELLGTV